MFACLLQVQGLNLTYQNSYSVVNLLLLMCLLKYKCKLMTTKYFLTIVELNKVREAAMVCLVLQ